jgi:hypothetical protein
VPIEFGLLTVQILQADHQTEFSIRAKFLMRLLDVGWSSSIKLAKSWTRGE